VIFFCVEFDGINISTSSLFLKIYIRQSTLYLINRGKNNSIQNFRFLKVVLRFVWKISKLRVKSLKSVIFGAIRLQGTHTCMVWQIGVFLQTLLGWFNDCSRILKKIESERGGGGQKCRELWTLLWGFHSVPEIKFALVDSSSKLKPKDYYLLSEFCPSFNGKKGHHVCIIIVLKTPG